MVSRAARSFSPLDMGDLFLDLHRISKRFAGVQALRDVDFAVRRGELHCLAGENGSGKSTLIKIISGVEQPEPGGAITVEDQRLTARLTPRTAVTHGVQVIYQDLALFPNLSVAENVALNRFVEQRRYFFHRGEARRVAREAVAKVGAGRLDPDEPVGELSLADQQLVAICRALMAEARLLIMDEPTTSLTRREVDALFGVVKDLQTKGLSVLFVSHKLDEVFEVADRVTILRDGAKVGTFPAAELTPASFTRHMSGLELNQTPPGNGGVSRAGTPRLEVRGLSRRESFADVSFTLAPGEIVGLTGLLGSGRTELALSLFGLNPADAGTVAVDGQPARVGSVREAVARGIAYVPENRIRQGLVMPETIAHNVALTTLQTDGQTFLRETALRAAARDWARRLGVKAESVDAPLESLSGGNQQKVVLAKWLATQPKVLILDGPTVGIDIAAKAAIYGIIRELAAAGMSILLISDELPEILHNCHRVLLMARGRLLPTSAGAILPTEAEVRQRLEVAMTA